MALCSGVRPVTAEPCSSLWESMLSGLLCGCFSSCLRASNSLACPLPPYLRISSPVALRFLDALPLFAAIANSLTCSLVFLLQLPNPSQLARRNHALLLPCFQYYPIAVARYQFFIVAVSRVPKSFALFWLRGSTPSFCQGFWFSATAFLFGSWVLSQSVIPSASVLSAHIHRFQSWSTTCSPILSCCERQLHPFVRRRRETR